MAGATSGPAAAGPPGYRIVQTIGHGASSTVYEAIQVSTGRRVALKVVAASTPGGDAERLYTRERAVLAKLGGHPHIVSIVDAGDWDGRFWLAMEHCPYGSVVQPGDRLSVQDAVALLTGIGSALEVAHSAGLVHCDVKPANMLRNQYGSPALADFGIAKFVLATGHGSTATGYTLDHASPEVLDGERPTGASDVWSLGTALWEVLEGHPPFRRSGEVAQSAVIRRICFDPMPHLTRDDVPAELHALIAEMTRKTPADRPALGEVVARAQALQAVVGAPDPGRWAQTIVAPLSPEHVAAPGTDPAMGGEHPAATSARPSLDELTNFRPGARREHTPPVVGEPETPARRFRAWPAVAAALLAVVLLGSGSVVTWRFASAASAPATTAAAPTPSSATSETPPDASTSSSEPAATVPDDGGGAAGGYAGGGYEGAGYGGGYAGGGGSAGSGDDPTASGPSDGTSTGSDSAPAGTADDTTDGRTDGTTDETGGDREAGGAGPTDSGDAPDGSRDGAGTTSEQQPTAPIASVKIVEPTCQPTSGSSCTATTGRISFKLKITDTQGDLITEDCQVSASVTKSGGSTRHGSGACTTKFQFDAGGAGTYTVRVKVTARGGTTPQEFTVRVR